MRNPFNRLLLVLFEKTNFLNGSYNTLCNQLSNYESLFNDSIEKSRFDIEVVYSGSSLLFQDVTDKPSSLCLTKYPSGKFEVKGAEYLHHLDEVRYREAAWCISQAYESFERFLNHSTYLLLELNPDYIDMKKKLKFEEKCPKLISCPDNYITNFVNYTYKTNLKKIGLLRKNIDSFKIFYANNYSLIDFKIWFRLMTKARNTITHNECIIKVDKINWGNYTNKFLNKYLPGEFIEDGYKLEFKSENVKSNLETFLDFGFLIYKCLSNDFKYDICDFESFF